MLENAGTMPRKKFPYLTDKDVLDLLPRRGGPKSIVSVRLTEEAVRVLDDECKRLGVKRGEALELILREIRELRKR